MVIADPHSVEISPHANPSRGPRYVYAENGKPVVSAQEPDIENRDADGHRESVAVQIVH